MALKELHDMLAKSEERKKTDEAKFKKLDDDLCMICFAYGEDKRSLRVSCFYAVNEVVPEMLDLKDGYFARVCKSCRASFLGKMGEWRDERIELRGIPKDHDGYVDNADTERNIPMRVNGSLVFMTQREWDEYSIKLNSKKYHERN